MGSTTIGGKQAAGAKRVTVGKNQAVNADIKHVVQPPMENKVDKGPTAAIGNNSAKDSTQVNGEEKEATTKRMVAAKDTAG